MKYSLNPINIIKDSYFNRNLILQLIKREVAGRYRGSKLGIVWTVINPILMLIIYTFVFSVVFNAKWGTAGGSKLEFALLLFCGISSFSLFSEVVIQAPRLILNNVNYVKKVIFPIEVLPLVLLGSSLFNLLINIIILVFGVFFALGVVNWTIIFLPIVILPLVLVSLGLGWFFASLGVYLRDIAPLITLGIQAMMFLSPIFYPISSIPGNFRQFFYMNPISYVVEDMRRIMVWGQIPNWKWLLIGTLVGIIIATCGYMWFQKTRRGFSDVL